jgi:phosphoglycolate phosphatase-like HAD superfamily hydrolase
MTGLNAVIWDADGTLLDSRRQAWAAAEGIISLIGGTPCRIASPEDERRLFGVPAQVNAVGEHAPTLRMMHRLVLKSRAKDIRPFREVLSVIHQISVTHLIATANLASGVAASLGDDARLFSSIRGFEHGPKADLIRELMAGRQCLYIGDVSRDVVICRDLGVPVVAVTWGGFEEPELVAAAQPNYLVETPTQLSQLLRSLL